MIEKTFLKQKELAERFCVSEGTIINWRKKGHLPFFRIPGSRHVLYPIDGILEVEQQYSTPTKETADRKQRKAEQKRKKPVISPTDKEWRI